MKYIDEFRNGKLARALARTIAREVNPEKNYRLMEFCGGHTHAISRYGLEDLLPKQVRMIHGPGCPVCVLPIGRTDSAIELALKKNVILCTYADTMRIPASGGLSLFKAKAQGADVRMVYSSSDALRIAQEEPEREVVFFGIGFETTTPPTAVVIKQAARLGLKNFSVFCNHVLTPAAMSHLMALSEGGGQDDVANSIQVDGFVGPSHVSTVIGSQPYEGFVEKYKKPVVIAGFEPLDVMQSILMLVRQINDGRAEVENQFTRVVTREGNQKAQHLMSEVFELRASFDWRGLGEVPNSALRIRDEFADFDAERRFNIAYRQVPDPKACECAAILRGQKHPSECKVFGTACTPDQPIGACMVSSEGGCAAYYSYGRFRVRN
jgi:hydrogenase expression/formation protein HypD